MRFKRITKENGSIYKSTPERVNSRNYRDGSSYLMGSCPYSFFVKYLLGHLNIADALSRLTEIEQAQTWNVAEEYIRLVANTVAPQAMTTEEIENASAVDEELEYVQQSVETGNWENFNCANYKPIRDELYLFGKIALRGTRIVVPKRLRAREIELGHEGH